jgi:hypothetical protein
LSRRFYKLSLIVLAAGLLFCSSRVQDSMNHDREALNLTRVEPLENAPPVLAFTTVALGGFRGLISNLLWMRATELQDQDKFFEMVQLADWITTLEPHYAQVWAFEAWNMGWNISVKFKDFPDRWRWLRQAIELLRDDALRYNPDDLLLYRELAWIFQDKMGKSTDDASLYYKRQWVQEMEEIFPTRNPDFDDLIHPRTPEAKKRARLLREKYKLDPAFMKEVNEKYGPLEWRLPEAHAIYWAAKGLQIAQNNPKRIQPGDIITLRRVIYQSMLLSFERGRLEISPVAFGFGPNLDIIPKVNEAYEQSIAEDKVNRENIEGAHRNFLIDAVYFLYLNNDIPDAAKWYQYLAKQYPDKPIIDNDPTSLPRNVTLREFAIDRVQEDINDLSPVRMKSVLEGLLSHSYTSLVFDEDDRALGYRNLALQAYQSYESKIPKSRESALGLGPFATIDKGVRDRLLDPEHGAPPEIRALLRTKLALPPEPPPAKAATNSSAAGSEAGNSEAGERVGK